MKKNLKKTKNIIGAFISSEKGQRFFNFAYSIGAAIVIWGALFKILHLPGGNTLLSIGMGTEVLMFLLTAFDAPPKDYKWEEVFPVLDSKKEEDRPDFHGGGGGVVINGNVDPANIGNINVSGATGSIQVVGNDGSVVTAEQTDQVSATVEQMTSATEQMQLFVEEMQHLRETTAALNNVSEILLRSYEAITHNSTDISDTSKGYVEQMQNLSRNITGLNTIYEIQLRSVSSQLDAIERVNQGIKDIRDMYEKSSEQSSRYCEETEKMARYMQQLNQVYEKMITAMTINMYRPMMGTEPPAAPQTTTPQTEPEYE